MSDKLTVFQKLSRVLGADSSSPAYIIDPKSFANLDAKELEQKKLEAKQTYFLQNQWKKIDNELYQKAVYYEPTRMASYYDYEAMEYCIAGDTKIATPDGFITIKELADKGRDYEFITYAYDHNLKKVVPAMARNAHYTRDEMTYKIIFDDGSHIITTWEHQLMKRDGSFERVMNLTPGESMMPFYRKSFYNNQKYNWVYTCNKDEGTNGWVAEHNLIATWFYADINKNEEVHHIDFNGKNDNPENLKIWDISEHRAYHARLNNEKLWSNSNYRAKMLEVSKRTDNKNRWNGERSGENNPAYVKIPFDLIIEVARTEKTLKKTAKKLNVYYRKIQRDIVNSGYRDWGTFTSAYGIEQSKYSTAKAKGEQLQLNHKIVSIEPHGVIPVYDLTVPGYKNFATDTIFSHNTPEIAAALDIFADEATTSNESGKILSIYSESTRIKNELTELFENNLDINTNLTAWARNLCKYGDNFVYNKIVPKKGIIGCIQLPNIEITRTEPGFTPVRNLDQYQEEIAIQFHWKDKNITFNSFEVSHFRLLGDDRKLPYGTCLKYDTRVDVEHGVKEIKDINIGDKVWSFDIKTQKRVLSSVLDVINSGTKTNYSINTKHNFIEASEEHKIMIFDGGDFIYKNVLDIKIGDLLVINKNVINPETNTVKIFKEEPSNNKNGWFNSINLLPNVVDYKFARLFGFLLGDGWIGNNRVNFALGEYDDLNDTYIGYLNELTSKPVKILKDKYGRETQAFVDSKMLTYVLENMGFVGKSYEKRIPNWVYELPIPLQKAFIEGLIDADGWATSDQWTTAMHIELANEELIKDLKILLQRIGYKTGSIRKRKDNGVKKYIDGRELKTKRDSYMITFYDSYNEQIIKYDNPNRISDGYILEPVTKIIETGKYETYDIYVENENHNFYANGIVVHNSMLEKVRRIWKQLLLSEDAMLVYRVTRAPERRVYKVFVGNMDDKDVDAYVDKIANNFKRTNIVNSNNGQQDTRYNPLAVDQDYFIPVRDPSLTMPIETLPGATNLSEIADIEYIQKKMLAALRVPKAFLGFDEATGEGKNLAILDIRFARAVHRIQKALIQELNKMAIIHLYLKGYEDDLNNFTLSLTTPSTQADILKVQNWKEKIQLYRDAVSDAGNGYAATSMTWAKKEILGMSDDDIKLDIQRQAVEKAGSEEIKMIAETIKQTGLFREIYKAYKINPDNMTAGGEQRPGSEPGSELDAAITGGGGGGASGLATDFTTPLETPGGEDDFGGEGGFATPETPEEESGVEEPEETLSERLKRNMNKRRGNITESLNKTISEIDKLLNE
jgi:intein/homing endonuclease